MTISPAATANMPNARPRIAIIGGGISGLAAAFRLSEILPAAQTEVLESTGRVGGILETFSKQGYLIERSADMFTTREPWGLNLCKRLGIENELVETNAKYRQAFVVRKGKLIPVPEGFTLMSPAKIWPIATTPLLSVWGKARLAGEMLVRKKKSAEDESLESFVVRRFGREAFDRLVQPLIGGIYTADPAKLSMQATMPQFIQLEEQFGSLIFGMRTQQSQKKKNTGSGARYGMFLAPKSGMGRIAEAIVNKLPTGAIRTNTVVTHLAEDKTHGGWLVTCEGDKSPAHYDAVVMAVPGPVMTRLLSPALPKLGSLFEKCEHAGCSVAVMGVRKDQLKHPLNGFGFVVPAIERRKILAGSFSSVKFDGRAPHDSVLIRVFVGGALQPHLGKLPDEEIRKIVMEELRSLLGMTGEPQFFDVVRWMNAMPQYHVGHLERVAAIEKLAAGLPSLGLAGNTLHGVGVPFCVHAGEQAAEKVAKHLQGN